MGDGHKVGRFMDGVMFNPVFVSRSGSYETEEGCLSLDGVRRAIRYQTVEVEYYDFRWKNSVRRFPDGRIRPAGTSWITRKGKSYSCR